MKNLLFLLCAVGLSLVTLQAQGQALSFDATTPGYLLARQTNSVAVAGEVDSSTFDALAGDVVSVSVDTPTGALDPYVELRNSPMGWLLRTKIQVPGWMRLSPPSHFYQAAPTRCVFWVGHQALESTV